MIYFVLNQGADEEELSDDELPPDVDLSDPFFAEELGATGDQYFQFINQSIRQSVTAVLLSLCWTAASVQTGRSTTIGYVLMTLFTNIDSNIQNMIKKEKKNRMQVLTDVFLCFPECL